jgi:hypothetical protein
MTWIGQLLGNLVGAAHTAGWFSKTLPIKDSEPNGGNSLEAPERAETVTASPDVAGDTQDRRPIGPIFRDYEAAVLESQLEGHLSDQIIDDIIENSEFVSYEFTGVGYFLAVRHPSVSHDRLVYHNNVKGVSGSLELGFVSFLEQGVLTFECFSYVGAVPENLRELAIEIFE